MYLSIQITYVLFYLCSIGLAAAFGEVPQQLAAKVRKREDDLAKFGQEIEILGLMERTDQDFVDGLAIDVLSPKNRTLKVQQNFSPLSGSFVSGSSGEAFLALSNYSYKVELNETANDMIAKIELPYDPVQVSSMGVHIADTYVGKLSKNKTSWVVSESQRNVHESENKTRIIKMTSLDGEYILLGRKNIDDANIFVQYGQGATRTVNVTGGAGVQEAEFIDGLRFSIEAKQPMKMNVEIRSQEVTEGSLPKGFTAGNSYVWVVNTTKAESLKRASLLVPYTPSRFASNAMPMLAYRPIGTGSTSKGGESTSQNGESSGFTILSSSGGHNGTHVKMRKNGGHSRRFAVTGLTQLDGEYLLVANTQGGEASSGGRSEGNSGGATNGSTSANPVFKGSGSGQNHVGSLLTNIITGFWILVVGCCWGVLI